MKGNLTIKMLDKQKVLYQGAEATILETKEGVIKKRLNKSYRLPELDKKIIKQRTKREAKLLEKALSLGILVPKVDETTENTIVMQEINGKKLSDSLDSLKNKNKTMERVGEQTAKMHDNNIIHGDLTTSNMILQENSGKIFFVDFGLGFISQKLEDKAVDLHLIKQALESKHFLHHEELFDSFLEGYKESKNSKKVLEQLKKVEARGRYHKNA